MLIFASFLLVICDPPCVHGACVSTNVCACGEGYEGSTCKVIGKRDLEEELEFYYYIYCSYCTMY